MKASGFSALQSQPIGLPSSGSGSGSGKLVLGAGFSGKLELGARLSWKAAGSPVREKASGLGTSGFFLALAFSSASRRPFSWALTSSGVCRRGSALRWQLHAPALQLGSQQLDPHLAGQLRQGFVR